MNAGSSLAKDSQIKKALSGRQPDDLLRFIFVLFCLVLFRFMFQLGWLDSGTFRIKCGDGACSRS